MTHHTDAERAEFEAWARGYGTWEVKRDDDVALGTTGYTDITLTVAWHAVQAARRAQAAPVPLRKPTIDQVADAVGYHASAWDCVGPRELIDAILMLAAAPQPPEAAPVQLPEYGIDTANHAGIRVRGYTEQQVRELLTDQQFKLDELAMLTRMVVHAFRQVAPDNKTAAKAVDYLKRKGLAGNPLRAAQEQST